MPPSLVSRIPALIIQSGSKLTFYPATFPYIEWYPVMQLCESSAKVGLVLNEYTNGWYVRMPTIRKVFQDIKPRQAALEILVILNPINTSNAFQFPSYARSIAEISLGLSYRFSPSTSSIEETARFYSIGQVDSRLVQGTWSPYGILNYPYTRDTKSSSISSFWKVD